MRMGFFSQSQLTAQTVLRCLCSPRVQSHVSKKLRPDTVVQIQPKTLSFLFFLFLFRSEILAGFSVLSNKLHFESKMGFIMYKLSIKIAYWFVVAFVMRNYLSV